ncbi:response regulator receiver domain-containing protein [Enterococcus mundtii]|nr:response regulator receiver domain-containing protein [Enterococcus mundtii]
MTKEQIFDRIWGFDSDTTITVVEVYMSNLRKHLRETGLDKEIKTLRNVGYILQGE